MTTPTLVTPALLEAVTALAIRAGAAIEQARAAGLAVTTKADAARCRRPTTPPMR